METKIRLARFGAKKKPFYRIVVATITSPRNGKFLEVVGDYDPVKGIQKARFKKDRVDFWIGRGARPTEIVSQIIRTSQKQGQVQA